MAEKMSNKEVACQTSGEDFGDALRINPFLVTRSEREKATKTSPAKAKGIVKEGQSAIIPNQRTVTRLVTPQQEICYPTDNGKRGLCVILEHDTFSPNLHLSGRSGSDVDLRAVSELFMKLGFGVQIHRNLNYADVMHVLDEVAIVMDHSDSDCFVLFLLSHGNLGTVYAYDAPYPTQKLWEPFTADRAPSLVGKPKLFFLQACQGSEMDVGVGVTETDSGAFASYKVPIHSDFLISQSTIAGFYSWRNTAQGSWFIQSLVKIFDEEFDHKDVVSMLTKVSRKVAKEYESRSSRSDFNNKKQTPFFYSTLTMKLYLNDYSQD